MMTRLSVLLRLSGVVVLLLAFLAGCGGEDPAEDPEPKMPSESATTEGGDPSDEPSEDPTKSERPQSAEAFIREWVRVTNEMVQKGRSGPYCKVAADCEPCMSTIRQVEQIYEDGGEVHTRGWEILSITDPGVKVKGEVHRVVHIRNYPTRYRERSGGPWKTLDGGDPKLQVAIVEDRTGWQIVDFWQPS